MAPTSQEYANQEAAVEYKVDSTIGNNGSLLVVYEDGSPHVAS